MSAKLIYFCLIYFLLYASSYFVVIKFKSRIVKIIDSNLFRAVKVSLVRKVHMPIIIRREAMVARISNVRLAK